MQRVYNTYQIQDKLKETTKNYISYILHNTNKIKPIKVLIINN